VKRHAFPSEKAGRLGGESQPAALPLGDKGLPLIVRPLVTPFAGPLNWTLGGS